MTRPALPAIRCVVLRASPEPSFLLVPILFCVLLASVLGFGWACSVDAEGEFIEVLALPDETLAVERWMQQYGWACKRGSPERWQVGPDELVMCSMDDTVMIGKQLDSPLPLSEWPKLRFEVRVDELPQGADIRQRSTDDAAFRLYLTFDRGGGLIRPPETLGYIWATVAPEEAVVESNHFRTVKRICFASGSRLRGQWIKVERDAAADYRLAFGDNTLPSIAAVGLKVDANHTGGRAQSRIRSLRLCRD